MTDINTQSTAIRPTTFPERILKGMADFFSFIFSPLLGPTYALIAACCTSRLLFLPGAIKMELILIVLGLTCLFPLIAIGVMYKMGIVTDPGLNKRKERTIPFIVSGLAYIACFIFFKIIHAADWLSMFIAGGLLAMVIAAIINLRWKISVHLTAMGGLTAFIIRLILEQEAYISPEGWLVFSIIAAGVVGTSRLLLRRHTLWQVAAGFANGFLCVYVLTI